MWILKKKPRLGKRSEIKADFLNPISGAPKLPAFPSKASKIPQRIRFTGAEGSARRSYRDIPF